MVYEEFLSTVQAALNSRLGNSYTTHRQKVLKNNGTVLDGLCIMKKGEHAAPTIYLNSFYELWQSGATMSEILKEILNIYEEGHEFPNIDPELFTDFTKLEDKVAYKLVHTKFNEERLTDLPHIPYLDLSIIFYLFLEENEHGHMTACIHQNHMAAWGVTKEKLLELASRNTPRILPAEIKSMEEVMADLIRSLPKDELSGELLHKQAQGVTPYPLYVLSNSYGINGSCSILYEDLLKNFANQLGQDLIILPSSIHEVLLIPYANDLSFDNLSQMVQYINMTEVPLEDRLSNQIYHYRRQDHQVVLIETSSKDQAS